jgi:MFS family permease
VRAAVVLPYGVLARAAPIAVTGCAVSGLVGGAFYALVPAWMQDQGAPRATIALFMLVAVLGGFAFQIPVGRLSDRFDRRIVLTFLSLGFAGTAFVMVLLPRSLPAIRKRCSDALLQRPL